MRSTPREGASKIATEFLSFGAPRAVAFGRFHTTEYMARTNSSSSVPAALLAALTAFGCAAFGCAVSDGDLDRWEKTLEGPKRLSAVVLYDKYPHKLRVDSAMSLIEMKPRKGQQVGIERLVKGTLLCDRAWIERKADEPCLRTQLTTETRAKIIADLVPRIIDELKKPAPPPAQSGQAVADQSYKFKDASYMLLTYDKTIIADAGLRQTLKDALKEWAMVDFARKLNDQSQMFGMEQLLREIGPSSVEKLPALMDRNSLRDLARIADLVDKLGEAKSKEEAGKKLVSIMEFIGSDAWKKEKEPEVKAANDARQLTPTDKQFAQQLEDYQQDTLGKILAAMKKVGGPSVTDFCLTFAANKKQSVKLRQLALVALEGHVDKKDVKSVGRLIDIAKNKETPKPVVDNTFRLLKQLPRDVVVKQLFDLLDIDDWQIRRLAGSTILQMSKVEHVGEFMTEISKRAKKNFNHQEARNYAAWIADMKEGKPVEKLKSFEKDNRVQARIIALAYYQALGTKKDLAAVKAFAEDKEKVPKCEEKDNNDCSWECEVPTSDKKVEKKKVETIGDFVNYCIVPVLQNREEKKKEDKPKDKPEEAPKEGDEGGK
jgi:hypothetical protein